MQGIRNPHDGLWDIPVAKTSITEHKNTPPVRAHVARGSSSHVHFDTNAV